MSVFMRVGRGERPVKVPLSARGYVCTYVHCKDAAVPQSISAR